MDVMQWIFAIGCPALQVWLFVVYGRLLWRQGAREGYGFAQEPYDPVYIKAGIHLLKNCGDEFPEVFTTFDEMIKRAKSTGWEFLDDETEEVTDLNDTQPMPSVCKPTETSIQAHKDACCIDANAKFTCPNCNTSLETILDSDKELCPSCDTQMCRTD